VYAFQPTVSRGDCSRSTQTTTSRPSLRWTKRERPRSTTPSISDAVNQRPPAVRRKMFGSPSRIRTTIRWLTRSVRSETIDLAFGANYRRTPARVSERIPISRCGERNCLEKLHSRNDDSLRWKSCAGRCGAGIRSGFSIEPVRTWHSFGAIATKFERVRKCASENRFP
jgi:hypothetical protein